MDAYEFLPRRSKFVEGSMNSRTSIRPPPAAFWEDIKIDAAVNKNARTTTITEVPIAPDGTEPGGASSAEGFFERFSRAAATLFRRKKEPEPPKDTRKEDAERAYHEAKRLGLLPEAKVFVRPNLRAGTAPGTGSPRTPRRSPTITRKELQRQAQLQKRVERLEHKLSETREKLNEALVPLTPQPAAPPNSTVNTPQTDTARSSVRKQGSGKTTKRRRTSGLGSDDAESTYKPSATENNSDSEDDFQEFGRMKHKSPGGTARTRASVASRIASPASDHTNMRSSSASQTLKRMSSGLQSQSKRVRRAASAASVNRLTRKSSSATISIRGKRTEEADSQETRDEVVMVVPDGLHVPPIPSIPDGVKGKRAQVSPSKSSHHNDNDDDGYGGLGHEIF